VLSALSHRERGGASRGEGASMPGMSEGRLPHPNPLPEGEGMIPVGVDGIVNLAALDAMLASGQPALVSVMLGNNETGIIQPVAEVAALCKKYQALFHCDAVQGLGKIAVDFGAIGADMMTVSAHKCGGPLGAAALVVRRDLAVTPLLRGGGQELGRRAGTENIAAIAGFALAVEKGYGSMAELRRWLDALEAEAVAAGGTVVGGSSPRLPNTSCIAMPGVSSEVQLMDFDLKGFAVSAGSACSSGRIEVSHVLAAMGVEKDIAACAIRVSGGWHTTQGEVLAFGQAWKKLRGRLGKK
jgi:cysteine desulfurase